MKFLKKMNAMARFAVVLMFFCSLTSEGFAQRMSIKTNALYWVNCTANLSMEFVMGERTTVEGMAFYTLPNDPFNLDVRGLSFDYRYWLAGRPMARSFVGVSATGTIYRLSNGGTLQNGDAGAFGLVYGYVLPLGKHWNVEFVSGFGITLFREKKYNKNLVNPSNEYNVKGHRFLPTKLGVSLAYTF